MTHVRLPAKDIIDGLQGREAIFIEHGALFVRAQIDINVEDRLLDCHLVEIPTIGFEQSVLHRSLKHSLNPSTNLLEFSVGFISGAGTISADCIETSGGIAFGVYFNPTALGIVKNIARQWTDDLDPIERYYEARNALFDYKHTFDPMPCTERFDISEFVS